MNRIFLMIFLFIVSNSAMADEEITYGEFDGYAWIFRELSRSERGEGGEYPMYSDAEKYCGSKIAGVSGWRMPTTGELIKLAKSYRGKINDTFSSDPYPSPEYGETRTIVYSDRGPISGYSVSRAGDRGRAWRFACVHDSLASSKKLKKFDPEEKVAEATLNFGEPQNTAIVNNESVKADKPSANKAAPSKPEPVQVKKDSGSKTGLILREDTTAADKAAEAKVLEEANKKVAEERKKEELANLKRLADEKKARDDAEARKKEQFKIVTNENSDYQLTEMTSKTWCQKDQERLNKDFSRGRNMLMSVGICSCKVVEHFPPLQPVYGCKYSYTYGEYESYAK